MAGSYDTVDKSRNSNLASIRDSLYLLATLNQYSISPSVLATNRGDSKPAEGLLRVALFSKDLRLIKRQRVIHELEHSQPVVEMTIPLAADLAQQLQAFDRISMDTNLEPPDELNAMRQKLAQQLRDSRRKGVVPVFISIGWFLFALAISIQSAFGYMGENAVAHDLALGLLLAWLPVEILCSIVDRNPVSADDIRKKLNRLIDHVRKSLMDDSIRTAFINTIDDVAERAEMRLRIEGLGEHCATMGDTPFFEKFSGQGRVKWHYGAAHAILCDVEEVYIAREGRNWLSDERRARTYLVLGKPSGGLEWFDYRELLQVTASFLCVGGTTFGAWILSFFTPTVGLGCRSGGYTIFAAIATGLLVVEMGLWWYWDARKTELKDLQRRATLNTQVASSAERILKVWLVTRRHLRRLSSLCGAAVASLMRTVLPEKADVVMRRKLSQLTTWLASLSAQQHWDYCFFRPVEVGNSAWLLYRTLAQTFGTDNTCDCMSSLWGRGGGYVDLTQWDISTSNDVRRFWIAGTTIGVTVMSTAMIYIVVEWCLQSHLSTANAAHAAQGLQRVRRFRHMAYPVRWLAHAIDDSFHAFECSVVSIFKSASILSKAYEVRPTGLRWTKAERASKGRRRSSAYSYARPSPAVVADGPDPTVPFIKEPGADEFTFEQTPPRAHMTGTRHPRLSDDTSISPSEFSRYLLSPDAHSRTAYERESSNGSPSEHSPERPVSPA
ncbi:hypothetical protein LTR17_006997 [Elasticomyces elasticus]|nr:hypothetical protein LTR17_006997 [Elasticomyces elasticus]